MKKATPVQNVKAAPEKLTKDEKERLAECIYVNPDEFTSFFKSCCAVVDTFFIGNDINISELDAIEREPIHATLYGRNGTRNKGTQDEMNSIYSFYLITDGGRLFRPHGVFDAVKLINILKKESKIEEATELVWANNYIKKRKLEAAKGKPN